MPRSPGATIIRSEGGARDGLSDSVEVGARTRLHAAVGQSRETTRMASNPLIETTRPGPGRPTAGAGTTNPLIRPATTVARGEGETAARRLAPATSAAALAVAAALIHLWVAPQHLAQWWVYGAFFLASAVGQGALGLVLLRRPAPGLVFAALWANVAIVVMYVVERTAGLPGWLQPGGSDAGHSHGDNTATMNYLGTAASVVEVALIVLLAAMLPGVYRRVAMNGLMAIGVVLWGLRLAGVL